MLDDSKRQRLNEELDNAHAVYVAASTMFDSLVTDTPSGLSHLDGILRIRQIGLEWRTALRHYTLALKRCAAAAE